MTAPVAYVDTSAFIKRFIEEPGTDRMEEFATNGDWRLAISSLTVTEFRSLLKRRQRDGSVTSTFAARATEQLLQEIAGGQLRYQAIDANMFNLAGELIERSRAPLGALDAIHLACAKATGASLMVSADRQLLHAARESGLETLDLAASPN